MSILTKIFQWPRNIPEPRDGRHVETPVDGSSEKVISDLFPTQCISASFPVDDVTTYGDMGPKMMADGNAMEFSSYVLRHMEPSERPGFTRCFFSRTISPQATVPAVTKTYLDDHLWYRILLKVDFVRDTSFGRTTRGPGGIEVYAPRYYPRIYSIAEATEGTLFQEFTFINSAIPTIRRSDCPQPNDVNFSILGVHGSFERCLHGKLIFDATKTAIVGYNAATSTVVPVSGAVGGQFFDETNYDEWVRYRKSVSIPQLVSNALWVHKETWVNPPEPSEVTVSTS